MDPKDVSRLFQSAKETEKAEDATIQGTFPSWLNGSMVQTGPGLLDLPEFTMNNYLDGFAILSKLEINGGKVKLAKKYPQTESYQKAIELGKPYFMEYGTTAKREGSKTGGFLSKLVTTFSRDDMSDNCSASMYTCGRHLIAASATSFFSQINPETLELEKRYDAKKLLGQNGFGVHPLIDEEGTMWNMGFSVPIARYNFVKIPAASRNNKAGMNEILSKGTTVASIAPRWTGGLSLNHSFGMSRNYIVFIEMPYIVKISRVLAATMKDYAVKDWLEWRGSEKNRFYLVEKATGRVSAIEYLSSESFFFLHVINCYEEDDKIIVDIARYDTPSSTDATPLDKLRKGFMDEVDPCSIDRYTIPIIENIKTVPENVNLLNSTSIQGNEAEASRKGNAVVLKPDRLIGQGAERTTMNRNFIGKKYSYVYATGSFLSLATPETSALAHSITKLNVQTGESKTWNGSETDFPSEGVFIPRESSLEATNEDEGVLLVTVSSSNENSNDYLVAIDGQSFEETGRASFQNQIPMSLHGVFLSSN